MEDPSIEHNKSTWTLAESPEELSTKNSKITDKQIPPALQFEAAGTWQCLQLPNAHLHATQLSSRPRSNVKKLKHIRYSPP